MDVKEKTSIHQELVRVGQILADRRVERNLEIADVSASLFILPEYLAAIEKADLDRLPAPTYIIGYVRSYANFLGLPAASLCQDMHNALSSSEKRPEFDFIETKVQSPNGSGRIALVSVLAGVLLYGGWYVFDAGLVTEKNVVAETPAVTVPQAPAAVVDSTIVAETPAGEEPVEPTFKEVQPFEAAPVTAPQETAAIDSPAAETPADDAPLAPAEPTLAETVAEPDSEAEPETVALVTPNLSAADALARDRDPDSEMVITAIGTSWVELNRADGSQIAAWLMRSGEVYTVSMDQDVYLTTGNAGGLSIALGDGTSVIPGNWGEAIRELPLDPTLISERNR